MYVNSIRLYAYGIQISSPQVSFSLNLSEGNAKRTEREKKRFYHTAYASCQECKTILKLAKIDDAETVNSADKLGAWLYKLLKSEIPAIDFTKINSKD